MNTINTPRIRSPLTTALLIGGAVAGPAFMIAVTIQGAVRPDYDPLRDSISALALGSGAGWIQNLNFVLTGVLTIGLAFGLLGATGRRTIWGPALAAVWGAGALLAGVFPTDPDPSYPPLNDGAATLQGMVHNWTAGMGFAALCVSTLVFARWFARGGQRGWALYSAISGAVFLIFTLLHNYFGRQLGRSLSDFGGLFQRCAVVIGFAWLTAVAIQFLFSARQDRRS